VANEAGNSIVVTDTQANIRHLVEIIEAIDNSAQGETEIRVFPLKHANPTDVANELGQIFQNNSTGNSQTQAPIRFGGGGGPGGFFARMAAAQATAGNNESSAVQKNSQVVAMADARTQSVIVSASKDLMDQIAGMMEQLDVPSQRDQGVYVFQMKNGDPEQAVQVLQNMFQSSSSSRGSTTTTTTQSPLQQRAQTSATTMGTTTTTTSTGVGGTGTGSGGSTSGRQF
jgi:general secretion pathway protein D